MLSRGKKGIGLIKQIFRMSTMKRHDFEDVLKIGKYLLLQVLRSPAHYRFSNSGLES
jgi:hypothetical protein